MAGLVAGGAAAHACSWCLTGSNTSCTCPPRCGRGCCLASWALTVYAVGRWIWQPLAALTNLRRLLSDEQAARRVGELFPQVQDRLLNALQLQGQARGNALVAGQPGAARRAAAASARLPRALIFSSKAGRCGSTRCRRWRCCCWLLAFFPSFITQGTERIWHYQRALLAARAVCSLW
ncbi:MAG: hypothetical protein WKG07_08335 [Hymenobacter sp.]